MRLTDVERAAFLSVQRRRLADVVSSDVVEIYMGNAQLPVEDANLFRPLIQRLFSRQLNEIDAELAALGVSIPAN